MTKRQMGLKMQTKEERKRPGLFGSFRYSKAWIERAEAIRARTAKKIERVRTRKADRLQAEKNRSPVVYSIK